MFYKAVLFDFDGVLANTFPYHYKAWQIVLQPERIEPQELTIRLNEGRPAWQIAMAIYNAAGITAPEQKAKRLKEEKNKIFQQIQKAGIYPEIFKIVDLILKNSMKTGLVTGTTLENIQAVLPGELIEKFSVIVKEGDTSKGKPFPDPYLSALQKLNIAPARCIVVENAPIGISSAKAAGTYCIALETTLPREHLSKADVIFKDHKELFFMLEKIIKDSI
ncbi:HAD family phosphatase [candidate division KSB1 bacterium]|nr:HAD family phosphatase [candidate division KSB1 bacterium]